MESINFNENGRPNKFSLSHRLQELNDKFIASGGEFKEYKIGNIFDIEKFWQYGKNKQYVSKLIDSTPKSIPVISGITTNSGINYYTEDSLTENEIFKDCLTISTRGEYSGTVIYHDGEFCLANNILAMPTGWSRNANLYFATLLQKLRYGGYFGYPTKDSLSKDIVTIPTKNNEINFTFMEEYISILEEERIRVLEDYLKVSQLNTYELTEAEYNALRDFENGNIVLKEFRIERLFKKQQLKFKKAKFNKQTDISKNASSEFDLPLVNAKDGDNGIMYYGRSCDFEYTENSIDIVNDGAVSTGSVYAQPQKTGVLYNAYLIKLKKHTPLPETLLFLSQSIQKTIKPAFSYDNKASWEKVKNKSITLPVKNNKIDFTFMETYIKAIEKKVIQDVIKWKDKEIAKTKSVCS